MNHTFGKTAARFFFIISIFLVFSGYSRHAAAHTARHEPTSADLIVYGGTPAGVIAAVAAARMGHSVIIVEPQVRIGGMTSGGLIRTDVGDEETIGGLSKEFFNRNLAYYVKQYGEGSKQVEKSYQGYFTEPHVAEQIFNEMVKEQANITVLTRHRLVDVAIQQQKIASIAIERVASGEQQTLSGKMFIDASYEGDLMAAAGVPYRVGRESQWEYNESFAGVNYGPKEIRGMGDHKLQAYNIRGTLTRREDIRVLFPKPDHYTPERFEAMKQKILQEGYTKLEELMPHLIGAEMPNGKHDNNDGDLPGVNFAYPEANWEERQQIYAMHRDHWLSLFYMLQNDPELPEAFRADARKWGLPSDEYPENNHITPQLYVREARRMVGKYVLTQNDIRTHRYKETTICVGSYNMDCHVVDYLMTAKGIVPEGGFIEPCDAYEIPYEIIVPHSNENLLVIGGFSATHVAYGSARMEPVFMMLGHAGGLAAHLALQSGSAVQDVAVKQLQSLLTQQGAILKAPYLPDVAIHFTPAEPKVGEEVTFTVEEKDVRAPLKKIWWSLDGTGEINATDKMVKHTFTSAKVNEITLLVEDENGLRSPFIKAEVPVGESAIRDVNVEAEDGEITGEWIRSRSPNYDFRLLYIDGDTKKGGKKTRFVPDLPKTGRYMVSVAYSPGENRATNVPVTIQHSDGTSNVTLDQSTASTLFVYKPLGEFRFEEGESGWVEISNAGTTGQVVVDAVKWIWLGDE
ncbi:FAD-dependent oxidoreductase [Parapedobacter koreensis]|nr:FAD-dependent oxidoreductase [Parapedobacter koreensis]